MKDPNTEAYEATRTEAKKLSAIVKDAATRDHGGYPDKSLLKLAKALKEAGL